jgi:hypothetical protein
VPTLEVLYDVCVWLGRLTRAGLRRTSEVLPTLVLQLEWCACDPRRDFGERSGSSASSLCGHHDGTQLGASGFGEGRSERPSLYATMVGEPAAPTGRGGAPTCGEIVPAAPSLARRPIAVGKCVCL